MASERFFLIIRAPNGDVREVPLGTHAVVVGRDESADVRVDDKKVSRRHASFKLIDGDPWVEDLGSSNGVRLNGKRIDKRSKVTYRDKVRVGGFYVTLKDRIEDTGASMFDAERPEGLSEPAVSVDGVDRTRPAPKVVERAAPEPDEDLPELTGLDAPVMGRVFRLHRGENIVGRLEECDVPILDGSVSRQHARLVFARDRVTATDLGSSNGIFVNEVRVDMAELAHGDVLRIGSIKFDVRLPFSIAQRFSGPVKTRARPKASSASGRRWVVFGIAGLISAALVVTGAIYLKVKGRRPAKDVPSLLAAAGTPDAGHDLDLLRDPQGASSDAGLGSASPPPAAPPPTAPPPTAPPPTAPPPTAPPPTAPPPTAPPPTAPPPTAPPPTDPAPPPASAIVAATGTATSPFSRRDAEGLPIRLPAADPTFDFDAFVSDKLGAATACEQAGDYRCLRERLQELLERDPINPEAKTMAGRADEFEKASASLAKADRHLAKGEFARAYRVLADIPEGVPQSGDAKARAEKLRQMAIDDELRRAKQEARRSAGWRRAHARYLRVLEMEPQSDAALRGIRAVERKMRRKNVEFPQYEPAVVPGGQAEVTDLKALNAAVLAHYGGDAELAKIAQTYARGALSKAQRRARRVGQSGPRKSRRRARQLQELLGTIKQRYERTRTEISNDPDRAWSMLMQLEKLERELLPEGVKSFVCRELEVSLGEAFAERGASMFDRGRFEEAFQGWVSGAKLDRTNPKVRAGLARLERKAEAMAQDAELASQRGDPGACEKWKRVTRITEAKSELHRKARERALALCR